VASPPRISTAKKLMHFFLLKIKLLCWAILGFVEIIEASQNLPRVTHVSGEGLGI
jgi:hypothetical protein